MTPIRCCIFLLLAALTPVPLRAAEIQSNGTGGGMWSEATTWHGSVVPGPQDSVTIAAHDTVIFDRNDDGTRTCLDLYIDPKGACLFKSGGTHVLTIAGPLESYGLVKLDASASSESRMEIRFAGTTAQRQLKLAKGRGLVLSGRPDLPEGGHNVIVSSTSASAPKPAAPAGVPVAPAPPVPATDLLTVITASAGTTLDVRHARLEGIALTASKIDNTGAKNNERINIANSSFTAAGSVTLDQCDTPGIVNNTFEYSGAALIQVCAITVSGSPLAEVRGNAVSGKYVYGIKGYGQTDTVVSDNRLENCGIYWYGSNDMLKSTTIKGADVGIVVTSMSGALEGITFDNCKTGLHVAGATVQATNLRFIEFPKDAAPILFSSGVVTLVNSDLEPAQIVMAKKITVTPAPRVTAMQYCVVAVKGKPPVDAAVDAATASPAKPLPKGAVDPNVLNGPAALDGSGVSPFPKSLKPLMLKSWVIAGDGSIQPPPLYNLSVIAKPDAPDQEPRRIKTVAVTPEASWYRTEPDEMKPTLEIVLP